MNSCLQLEAILALLWTETFAREFIFKFSLEESCAYPIQQRLANSIMAREKLEGCEKQRQAALHLAKQKHKIAMRQKELEMEIEQMAIEELEEDNRQRVAAAKLNEAQTMNNRSLFSHQSSENNLHKVRGSNRGQKLDMDWVPTGTSLTTASESNCLVLVW